MTKEDADNIRHLMNAILLIMKFDTTNESNLIRDSLRNVEFLLERMHKDRD